MQDIKSLGLFQWSFPALDFLNLLMYLLVFLIHIYMSTLMYTTTVYHFYHYSNHYRCLCDCIYA